MKKKRLREMTWEDYGISRHRYEELRAFCLQYDEKKSKIQRGLSAVSRYIKEAGLGDERYKGKVIPSTGSAPVTAAVYNGGTGKKG